MKKILRSALLFGLVAAAPSFASFFETCTVKAEVVSIKELSVFGKGSHSAPGGADGEGENTFVRLLKLKVLEIEKAVGHTDCSGIFNRNHEVVLESSSSLRNVIAGDELKLVRDQFSSRLSGYSETWSLQSP